MRFLVLFAFEALWGVVAFTVGYTMARGRPWWRR